VLLRETLKKTGKVGVGRVVIRTKEYLAAVMPQGEALVLNLLRYKSEVVDADDFELPGKSTADYRISPREIDMAADLIESMSSKWKPEDYRDDFRDKLRKAIEKRLKTKGVTTTIEDEDDHAPENATTNVVDFMALLKKSLGAKTRTPARKAAAEAASSAKRVPAKKAPAKEAATRKAAPKKAAAKAATKAPSKASATRKAPATRRKAG
jgi:DNA end-binding protein Ku